MTGWMPALAQDAQRPWAVHGGIMHREYSGELGMGLLKYANSALQPSLGFSRYLNPWFEAGINASYGETRYQGDLGQLPVVSRYSFKGFHTDLAVRLKGNNGWMLKQDARLRPYLFGSVAWQTGNNNGLDSANAFSYLSFPVGGGFRVALNRYLGFYAEMAYIFALDDASDGRISGGNDRFMHHRMGFTVSLPACGKPKGDEPDEDGDGVPDSKDRCPGTPRGTPVNRFGCPKVLTAEEESQVLRSTSSIKFDFNSDKLQESSHASLDNLYALLQKYPGSKLIVEGHTDNVGSDEFNLKLSQRRADAVKNYLVAKGIDAGRIAAQGYGETVPIASNDTEEGRAINRRVELIFTR
jgi:outer membrane protein OmpA-like peptidoglycan-associated protein